MCHLVGRSFERNSLNLFETFPYLLVSYFYATFPNTMAPPARTGRHAGRQVTIDDIESSDTFATCNSQLSSPLFSQLPREIRESIWALATAPFEDEERPYHEQQYCYRPGHTHRLKTHVSLLLTCRRIWLEANRLPMLQAEHCFYYHRSAPDARTRAWMDALTPLNRKNCGSLHLFAQMLAIEPLTAAPGAVRDYFLSTPRHEGDFQPRMLKVTIRHTDWWMRSCAYILSCSCYIAALTHWLTRT